MRFNFALAAVAATLAATPAVAQQATTTEPAEARGLVLQSLTLTKSTDLDFGTVAGSNTVPGTVDIDSDNGARTATGGVSLMPGHLRLARGVPVTDRAHSAASRHGADEHGGVR
jgi:hypothetical protein